MLTSLLDGARDVRSALVAGAAWVAVIFLVWPGSESVFSLDQDVSERLDWLTSRTNVTLLLLLVPLPIQLLGSSYLYVVERQLQRVERSYLGRVVLDDYGEGRLKTFRPITTVAFVRLNELAESVYPTLKPAKRVDRQGREITEERYVRRVLGESLLAHTQLLSENKEIYDRIDQGRTEAELRDGVSVQLFALVAGLPLYTSAHVAFMLPLALVGAAMVSSLFIQARRSRRWATSITAHALADGLIASRSLRSGTTQSVDRLEP